MNVFVIAALAISFQKGPAREIQFTVPPGFAVDRPSDLTGSLLSIAFGPDGNVFIGRESECIVRLADRDGDGRYERLDDPVDKELIACQGLSMSRRGEWKDGSLWAIGLRAGKSGLWEIPMMAGNQSTGINLALEFTAGGEHGPHAILGQSDGGAYLVVGNQSALLGAASHPSEFWQGDEGRLLKPYPDPLGYGAQVRYPGGFIARLDAGDRWQYAAVGLRNVYDVAQDERGNLFAVDSDMEWDVGLPWYRPVRLLEILAGSDYGSRAGSSVIPDWCVDTQPALLDLGRGSPTGAVFGTRTKFPDKWRKALFSGDWSQGKILAIWTGADEDGNGPASVEFLAADTALPVTDVDVGPDGALWFLTGGRGIQGGVFRVRYEGQAGEASPGDRAPSVPKIVEQMERDLLMRDVRKLMQGERVTPSTPASKRFTRFDRKSWPLELRVVAATASEEELDALLRSNLLEQRVAALIVLGSRRSLGSQSSKLVVSGVGLLEALALSKDPRGELTLAVLRGLELCLLRQGDPPPELAQRLATRLLSMLPNEDPHIAGEVAVLLSHLDDPRALEPLLREMQKSPQELAIHYGDCAHRMTRGWDVDRRAVLLEWFAKSREYKGGISLPGYLSAMRAHFIETMPAAACLELAPREGIDAESLALLLARLPPQRAVELFPRYEALLARLVPAAFGTPEQVAKDSALRALEKLDLAEVEALARRLAQREGDVLEAPWALLARTPQARDFELWLGAIVSASAPKRDAAFRALSSLDQAPQTAEVWRTLLDQAREIGSRRGRELMRILARWCAAAGGAPPSGAVESPAEFDAALSAVEGWYREKYPSGAPPADPSARPQWSEAQIHAFLERSKERPGSAAHGRIVFEQASCQTCHALGQTAASDARGFGPDLANVTDRLSTADLLAAIVAPSRVVSDQYRAFVARTTDERQFEGIVTRRDAKGVELQPIGGERIWIDVDELESLEPSPRSTMPEGLLESRTLEEIRDLFAYLKTTEPPAASRSWSALFGPDGVEGWNGDSAVWSLRASTMTGRSGGLPRSSYLMAPMPAQDMLVEFDVLLPPGGNSGLCYRAERPSDPAQSDPSGLQADLGQSYWGSLYSGDGATLAKPDAQALEPALDRNGWNHVLVRIEGDRHSMEVNGFETYSVQSVGVPGTLFGFQVHQGKPMVVRIANARWRAP